jgi:hypothetical protein
VREWSFDSRADEHGLALIDLVIERARQLDRHKALIAAARLADPRLRSEATLALGLPEQTSPGQILAQVDLTIAPLEHDMAPFERLSTLIAESGSVYLDAQASERVLSMLQDVHRRARSLAGRLAAIRLPATSAELAADLRDPARRRGLHFLASLGASGAVEALLTAAADQSHAAAVRAIQSKRDAWLALCARTIGVVSFRDGSAPAGAPPVFQFEIVASGGKLDLSPADRGKPGIWAYVLRFLRDLAASIESLLAPALTGAARPPVEGGVPINAEHATRGALQFLPIVPADELLDVVGRSVDGTAQPISAADTRAILDELSKTRFVRKRMASLFGLVSPASIHRAYDPHHIAPEGAGGAVHSAYVHRLRLLGTRRGSEAAFTVDRWIDFVPSAAETTAVIVNYDAPSAEAPNALVLCAPPMLWWSSRRIAQSIANVIDVMRLRTLTANEVTGNAAMADDFRRHASCVVEVRTPGEIK